MVQNTTSRSANPAQHTLLAGLTAPPGALAIACGTAPRGGRRGAAGPAAGYGNGGAAPGGAGRRQKPNFHINRTKVFNSGPSSSFWHPCSLCSDSPPGCPWASGRQELWPWHPGVGGGAGSPGLSQVFRGKFGALWVQITAVLAAPQSQPRSTGTLSETIVFPNRASAVLKLPDKGLIETPIMTIKPTPWLHQRVVKLPYNLLLCLPQKRSPT